MRGRCIPQHPLLFVNIFEILRPFVDFCAGNAYANDGCFADERIFAGHKKPDEVIGAMVSDEILSAYLKVSQHASRQFRTHFGKLNLTFPQALVLNALLEEAPVPISTLAEKTGSANSTISGIVDRLEKLELVQRERGSADRRVIYVNLTPKCCRLRDNAGSNVRGYFAELMNNLEMEEQQRILEALLTLDRVLSGGGEQ